MKNKNICPSIGDRGTLLPRFLSEMRIDGRIFERRRCIQSTRRRRKWIAPSAGRIILEAIDRKTGRRGRRWRRSLIGNATLEANPSRVQ